MKNLILMATTFLSFSSYATNAKIECQFGDDGTSFVYAAANLTEATMTIDQDAKTFHATAHYKAIVGNTADMVMDGILRVTTEKTDDKSDFVVFELLKEHHTVTMKDGSTSPNRPPSVDTDDFPQTLGQFFYNGNGNPTGSFYDTDQSFLFYRHTRATADPIPATCKRVSNN